MELKTNNTNNKTICFNYSYNYPDNYTYLNTETEEWEEIVSYLNMTKDELLDNLPHIIDSINIGEDYKLYGKDFNLVIKPTNSSFLDNSTHVNFKKCEGILRDKLNISPLRIITFLQVEIYDKNPQSLTNKVEYQAYDDNKNLLDLSLCNDVEIQVFHSLKDDSYDFSEYNNFKNEGIDIFNIDDSFFNDICQPFSDSNNDLVLEDRIKDIYQNYSLCEENCTYNSIDFENKTISCDCKVKANISVEEQVLNIKQFNEIKIESNFGLIKCYKIVFSLKGKLTNIGFWIFLILVITHLPFLFVYFHKGIKPIEEYLHKEMIKFGYIRDNNENAKILQKRQKINHNPPKSKKKIKLKEDNSSMNQIKSSMINLKYINSNEIKDINNEKKRGNGKESNKKILIKNNELLKKRKGSINNKKNQSRNLAIVPTQGIIIKEKNEEDENSEVGKNNINIDAKEKENDFNLNLISINLNRINIEEYKPKNSLHILNIYSFEEAIEYDMRSICAIFYIFLLSKQALLHAFLYRSPLEVFPLRFCLFLFIISNDLALNAIFYLDDKISKKYRYVKNLFLFTFNNNITIILLSTFIGFLFLTLFTNLSNSTNEIREVFRIIEDKIKSDKKYIVTEENKKDAIKEIEKILKKHKIKVTIFIIVEVLLIIFFWYYVTAFCHVYSNTQVSWILDSLLSMISRLFIELLLSLGFAKLYRIAVEANIYCIYKIVLFFYNFG